RLRARSPRWRTGRSSAAEAACLWAVATTRPARRPATTGGSRSLERRAPIGTGEQLREIRSPPRGSPCEFRPLAAGLLRHRAQRPARSEARVAAPRCHAGSTSDRGVSLLHLLREVVLLADLPDQLELGLEPVGVLLLADEDPREQVLGRVVARLARGVDALVQERDRRVLE